MNNQMINNQITSLKKKNKKTTFSPSECPVTITEKSGKRYCNS